MWGYHCLVESVAQKKDSTTPGWRSSGSILDPLDVCEHDCTQISPEPGHEMPTSAPGYYRNTEWLSYQPEENTPIAFNNLQAGGGRWYRTTSVRHVTSHLCVGSFPCTVPWRRAWRPAAPWGESRGELILREQGTEGLWCRGRGDGALKELWHQKCSEDIQKEEDCCQHCKVLPLPSKARVACTVPGRCLWAFCFLIVPQARLNWTRL